MLTGPTIYLPVGVSKTASAPRYNMSRLNREMKITLHRHLLAATADVRDTGDAEATDKHLVFQ
ncbi:hypothetical protein RE428_20740 [Marinobacter nanhaiticus D15-8W]|uniref:Uncharacterized protein n=1 Tax=Marinobacter nanhaiticus D15-8W TaxID=626887 RepID=N6W0Q9_9GAMM|nr:hypothetical protein J057_19850 [Marinobacter nanhaiticus D15-8W]BES71056.1 hypothetical protein RE428_20740 [Marinobacter nanhaiticus D15-8W]